MGGTAVVAGMAEAAAGSRGIAGSMAAGGATGPPRTVQHVEETLMAALLHLGAGEGWTVHPPAQTSMKLARFLLKCTENVFMVAKLDLTACQVYRNLRPDQVGPIILRACALSRRVGP